MRFVGTFLLGLLLYLVFLVVRFPYDTLVERSVRLLEASTGASVIYTPVSAGPLGVQVRDLVLTLASGASLSFSEALIRPTTSGLVARLGQDEGQATARLSHRQLTVTLNDVEVETASEELGLTRLSGDLTYDLRGRQGQGHLRMVVPNFRAPLPIPETPLEVGASFNIANAGTQEQPRSRVASDVRLVTQDQKFSADGTVTIESQVTGQRALSGNLRFESPQGRGMLRVGGTWKNPTWAVVPN